MADGRIPLNATFEAFRRRDRMVLLPATLAYLALSIALFAGFVALNIGALPEVISWYASVIGMAVGDPGAVPPAPPAALFSLLPSYLIVVLLAYILFAAYEAACLRWMIRGETEGLFGLSLGADTWRVYAGYWVWFGLVIGAYFAMVVAGLLAGLIAVGLGSVLGEIAVGVWMFLFVIALIGAMIYFSVRMTPANAASIGLRRFAFFDAWNITKGRFWAIFGAFLLIGLLYFVGYLVLGGVGFALIGSMLPATWMSDPMQIFTPETIAVIGPMVALVYLAYAVLAMVILLMWFGVNARAVSVAIEEGVVTPRP